MSTMVKPTPALPDKGQVLPPMALLGTGQVRHTRLRPVRHQFSYASYFLMLPMRHLRRQPDPSLPRNRWSWLSFHDGDHGDGRGDSLAWLDETLLSQGVLNADGEVWLHCFPRVLGYVFKPVSFWYCHRQDGQLRAILVEVNNTFGERHCYLLDGPELAYGREQCARKVFHVSPFCKVEGRYRFRFIHRQQGGLRTLARIDHDDSEGPLIQTSISGALVPVSASAIRRAFFGVPLMTFGLMARIHWQALKLAWRRVPFFRKPTPPAAFVTR